MSKQKGILKFTGTMGGVTFYKTAADGFLAREKGGVSKDRIATDPNFQRTRENGEEFGRAGKAGKLLRNSIRGLLLNVADSRMSNRLTQRMVKVVQADETNERGKRNVIDGEAELLQDFEFNKNSKLGTTLYAPYTTNIDRVTGKLTVDIPAFIPGNMVSAPAGATHFKIISGAAEIDFENETYVVDTQQGPELPWDNTLTAVINLENEITPASTHPLFLALGIEFYQEVNGEMYPLKNGAFNSLALVKVSGV